MRITEIKNQKVWNAFVTNIAPDAFFQSWEWGEIEKKNGHVVTRWGMYEDANLIGGAQAVEIRAKRGNYLHVRYGPVLKEWTVFYLKLLVDFLRKEAKNKSLSFIRVNPLIGTSGINILQESGFGKSPMHTIDGEICYVVDLQKSDEQIFARMRKNTRRTIRNSLKENNLRIKKGTSSRLLYDFLWLFRKTAKRNYFVTERNIETEVCILKDNDNTKLILGYHRDTPVAGALIDFWGNQGIYHHAAASELGLELNAAYRVVWEALKETKKRGLSFFNLWGGISDIDDKSHPWWGLTIFKRGFGSVRKEYLHAMDLPLSWRYWRTYFFETLIRYIRGYDSILGLRAPTFLRELFKV